MSTHLKRQGRCHVFGNDVPLDDGLIPFDMAIRRIDDPALLIPELFKMIAPDFSARVQRGDIIVAGAGFGCGKPHFQGFIAMAALGLSIVCASAPYKTLRGAISKGVPILTGLPEGHSLRTGDRLDVDFGQGTLANLDTGARFELPPLPPVLRELVVHGGTRGMLAAWLASHPDLKHGPPREARTPGMD